INAETEKLVTVIEFLSPTNKRRGEEMRQYRGKRKELLNAGVHVVEVDLVREGDWKRLLLPYVAHPKYFTPYRVTVHKGDDGASVNLYPISLRQRLPIIPVPLRPTDPEVTLDLQALIEQAYKNGRYDRTDYRKPKRD